MFPFPLHCSLYKSKRAYKVSRDKYYHTVNKVPAASASSQCIPKIKPQGHAFKEHLMKQILALYVVTMCFTRKTGNS